MPNFIAGSNEFVAESSANTQAKFYSVQLGTGQGHLKYIVEWVYRGFFRSLGIRTDPVFTTKRTNVVERLEEARAFSAIMEGIAKAVESGMSLPTAVTFYEEESGMMLSAQVKSNIETEWMERKEREEGTDATESAESDIQSS